MAEKTLDPTHHRLQEARKKGQVPVSRDLASCLLMAVGFEATFALEQRCRVQWAHLFELAVAGVGVDFYSVFSGMLSVAGTLLLATFLLYLVVNLFAGVLGFWGQFGVMFSATPLVPDFTKLNPAGVVKNIFSSRKLIEVGLSMIKLIAIGLVSYLVIRSELPAMISLASGNTDQAYAGAVEVLHGLFRALLAVCAVLAVMDLFVQRAAHKKQLRMSIDEVIREYKENEGDPMLKGARRMMAFEILNADPVERTGSANAVVVNPTHFAVALFFDPKTQQVPVVCAKGADHTARAMIQRAQQMGIPVVRHVWLARTLFAVAKEDKLIPRTLFDPVALLYSVVEQLRAQGSVYAELDTVGSPPMEA